MYLVFVGPVNQFAKYSKSNPIDWVLYRGDIEMSLVFLINNTGFALVSWVFQKNYRTRLFGVQIKVLGSLSFTKVWVCLSINSYQWQQKCYFNIFLKKYLNIVKLLNVVKLQKYVPSVSSLIFIWRGWLSKIDKGDVEG